MKKSVYFSYTYYDYDHAYNFRDRDAPVMGGVVAQMWTSFEHFSQHPLAADFPALARELTWGRIDFISDLPGNNDGSQGLGGGGLSMTSLAALLEFAGNVRVSISTNPLASTAYLQAFSGYRSQCVLLGELGIDVREFRSDPAIETTLMQRYAALHDKTPVFALHARLLVVDWRVTYIGTYNIAPRPENLITEAGIVIHDTTQAQCVANAILVDMQPGISWDDLADDPDAAAPGSSVSRYDSGSFYRCTHCSDRHAPLCLVPTSC